jgi:hypothetical protein
VNQAWRGLAVLALTLGVALHCRTAAAQLGTYGSPIRTSHYSLDLYQGPVIASTRVIGMGGAYVAIAEGVEASYYNPAGPAVRVPWSRHNVDYDLGAGITSPGTLERSDFFNSGGDRTNLATSNPGYYVFLDAEGQLQIDRWGFGAGVAMQQYNLRRDTGTSQNAQTDKLNAQVYVMLLQVARATADGQLIVGLGLRPSALNVVNEHTNSVQPTLMFSTQGIGYAAGLLWRPNDLPLRVGASFNSAVTTRANASSTGIRLDAEGNRVIAQSTADQMYLPETVSLPWDFDMGVAVQLGPRPFNPQWLSPSDLVRPLRRRIEWRRLERERVRRQAIAEAKDDPEQLGRITTKLDQEEKTAADADATELDREKRRIDEELRDRERRLARGYILVSTSLRISGSVSNAVGVESFLQRFVDRSGRRTVASPHLGLESEVIANWLKLRAGAYGEPTRFSNPHSAPRLHTTFGFEQKLFPWNVFGLFGAGTAWRIQMAADFSASYFGWSGSVGVWH